MDAANGYCGYCHDVTGIDQRQWDDDAHDGTVMRVHVHERRVLDLLDYYSAHHLRLHAAKRGIPSGGIKRTLAERIVEHGFTAGDLRHAIIRPRFTPPNRQETAP